MVVLPERERATSQFFQWIYTAMAAGSFAALLLIVGQGWKDVEAMRALNCFAFALPLHAGAAFLYGEPRRMYVVRFLAHLIPMLSTLVFIAGLFFLISRSNGLAALVLAGATLFQIWTLAAAHNRFRQAVRGSESRPNAASKRE
ncbi:MAG: hypothetical protein QM783_16080 [Phycisphaerales bacterium]